MPCYSPILGWRAKVPNKNGAYPIVFDFKTAQQDHEVYLPCGGCIGCRLDNSREWAVRCINEASLHSENSFLTLTYDDDHLPYGETLVKKDLRQFMKRLRKSIDKPIKFKACGEYGDELGRPHYHVLLFGHDFKDVEVVQRNHLDQPHFRSPSLSKLWPLGHHVIGGVTFQSAAYVCRYIVKKQNGEVAQDHYTRVDPETGEFWDVIPEFTTQSNRSGGIGADWVRKYPNDCKKGYITIEGRKHPVPKYYANVLREEFPEAYEVLKENRRVQIDNQHPDVLANRLAVREQIKQRKLSKLKRNLL